MTMILRQSLSILILETPDLSHLPFISRLNTFMLLLVTQQQLHFARYPLSSRVSYSLFPVPDRLTFVLSSSGFVIAID